MKGFLKVFFLRVCKVPTIFSRRTVKQALLVTLSSLLATLFALITSGIIANLITHMYCVHT